MISVEQKNLNPDTVAAMSSSGGLQQFAKDPFLYISRWYRSALRSAEPQCSAHAPSAPENGVEAPAAHPRLHGRAESYVSSLKAGTASIIIQDREQAVNFLQLPVSACDSV